MVVCANISCHHLDLFQHLFLPLLRVAQFRCIWRNFHVLDVSISITTDLQLPVYPSDLLEFSIGNMRCFTNLGLRRNCLLHTHKYIIAVQLHPKYLYASINSFSYLDLCSWRLLCPYMPRFAYMPPLVEHVIRALFILKWWQGDGELLLQQRSQVLPLSTCVTEWNALKCSTKNRAHLFSFFFIVIISSTTV